MKMLDLFSGIGGFHLGFKQAGFEFDYVGFSEIDKYASAVYKYNNPFAEELGNVKSIRSKNLPKIDIITFGSPCQDFSIASKRAGLKGTRSSLIWEAIRLINECKPRFFVWENVKGTFSSNDGRDFWAIIQAFTNIGSYRLEWQLLNTRWFLPQNRERLYLVGYTGDRGGRSVFPSENDDEKFKKLTKKKSRSWKWFQTTNTSSTITSPEKMRNTDTFIQAFTERSFDGNREDGGRAIRYHKVPGETPCLSSNMGTGGNNIPMMFDEKYIRRLTCVECMRLQGFPDNHNEFGLLGGKKIAISDTQRYRQAGNAVTVNVVEAVARKIKKYYE